VPIGVEVARALNAPLDLLLVRKIGLPWQPELALAAVVDGTPPDIVIDEEVRRGTDIDDAYIEAQAEQELQEIRRRRQVYLRGRPPVDVQACTAVVVDDGIATGTTMRAALKALRRRRPARLVVAVPVAPPDTIEALASEADRSSAWSSRIRSMRWACTTASSTRSATTKCSRRWRASARRRRGTEIAGLVELVFEAVADQRGRVG
jgi:putative phosphoribosyl transferase